MAFCSKCGQQINDGVKFCPACGNPMEPATQQEQSAQSTESTADTIGGKLSNLNNTADKTADFDKADIEQNKVMAILAYLGILVLVPILAAPNSKFARFHANQGVLLCIAWIAWLIVDTILTIILRAIFGHMELFSVYYLFATILNLVYLVFTVLVILGIINVVNGRAKELPVIGKFKILK